MIILYVYLQLQKADPTQFIQIYGRRCKIHLDPAIAAAGESPAIMQVIFDSFKQNRCVYLKSDSAFCVFCCCLFCFSASNINVGII